LQKRLRQGFGRRRQRLFIHLEQAVSDATLKAKPTALLDTLAGLSASSPPACTIPMRSGTSCSPLP